MIYAYENNGARKSKNDSCRFCSPEINLQEHSHCEQLSRHLNANAFKCRNSTCQKHLPQVHFQIGDEAKSGWIGAGRVFRGTLKQT